MSAGPATSQCRQGGNALRTIYAYNRIIGKGRFLVWVK